MKTNTLVIPLKPQLLIPVNTKTFVSPVKTHLVIPAKTNTLVISGENRNPGK